MMNQIRRAGLAALLAAALPATVLAQNKLHQPPSLPSAYPAEWNVIYGPTRPLPPGYDFGRRTTVSMATAPTHRRASSICVRSTAAP